MYDFDPQRPSLATKVTSNGKSTTYEYDSCDRVTVTDTLGNKTVYTYDSLSRAW